MKRIGKAIAENANPLLFTSGTCLVAIGLWLIGPEWAFIVSGSIIICAVSADVALKTLGAKKRGEE